MMKKNLYTFLFLWLTTWAYGQKSPEEFLGYPLGERFTPHHRVVAYFEHVAANSPLVKLQYYGESYEHRPLFVAVISSEANMSRLEQIREDNLKRTGLLAGNPETGLAINWMQYNVHGNEAVATEAALMTFWDLVNPEDSRYKSWLENQIVLIDPCANPDGKDRYTVWYNQKQNKRLQPDPQSVEHSEPWPGGRPNHYLLDLNRDWAWQTQQETKQRLELYHQWMPHLFVDFHEQGINDPFYFAPAAKPVHKQVTGFQREFQEIYGKNTAEKFDAQGWLYFTKERFDLLYPAYGDTYPMYNGAIGMTIEKGGSGRAGLGMLNALKDTVTLKERIEHQHIAGISAVEVAAKEAQKLADNFTAFFKDNRENPQGKYKSFILKVGDQPERLRGLLALLDLNKVTYGELGRKATFSGLDYQTGKTRSFTAEAKDIVVSADQPKSVLAQILFEPEAVLEDSLTYDITSWALPYAHGVEAYALDRVIRPEREFEAAAFRQNEVQTGTLAYISPWRASVHPRFLAALLDKKVRVRYASYPFELDGKKHPAGALIIHRNGNDKIASFDSLVVATANTFEVELTSTKSGMVTLGKDFGSSDVRAIKAPKVALLSGPGTSSLNFGEIWYHFEQELDYPLSILELSNVGRYDLSTYDVLIMPSGSGLLRGQDKKIKDWVRAGGKLILMEGALAEFAADDDFSLKRFLKDEQEKAAKDRAKEREEKRILAPYQSNERARVSGQVAGAVFEVNLDETHPLGYGYGGTYYTLKNSASRYGYLKNGVNAGTIRNLEQYRFGFVGSEVKPSLAESLVVGSESMGRGQVVYFVDNPMFRSFWENGKLLFGNAVFLVGQ